MIAGRRAPWREGASGRRRQVAERLRGLGLAAGGRRDVPPPSSPGELGGRLRDACLELGLAFAVYGRYLASRADLFEPVDLLALAEIPDAAPPVPPAGIRRLLREELGRSEELLTAFDEAPLASGLLFQWHRAATAGGDAVVMKLVRPDLGERFGEDPELLALLQPPGPPLDGVVAEHRAALAATVDLASEGRALEALAAESWDGASPVVPRVLPELSAARVLTTRWPAGAGLATMESRSGAANLARRLAFVWLRQALLGRTVPVEPGPGSLLVPPGGGITFLGGPAVSPPAAVQGAFQELLISVADNDPEAAAAVFLRETEVGAGAVDEETLVLRLRQVVPFRDGAWSPDGVSLPEHLFGYWRTVRRCGRRSRRPFLDLLRGLVAVAVVTRRLDPAGDPFRDALRDVRLEAGFSGLRAGFGGNAAEGLAPYAAFLSQVPRKLDQLLTLLSEGETHLKLHLADVEHRRRHSDRWIAMAALGVALAVVVLVTPRLVEAGVLETLGERIVAAVVAVLGIALLRAAGSRD